MKNRNTPRLAVNPAGNYEIRWTEDRVTRRISCNTKDKAEAERKLAMHLLKETKADQNSTAVWSILSSYESEHVDKRVVDKDRQTDCLAVLNVGFDGYDVHHLTPDVIAGYCEARKAGRINGRKVCDSTLRRELNCLVAAINHAVRHRRIKQADVPHIDLPAAPPPKDLWLTSDELDLFIDCAVERYGHLSRIHRFIVIASETAARKNSIVRLRWGQVSLSSGIINYQNDGGPRTKKRRVPVPMSDALLALFQEAWDARTQDEWVLDTEYSIQHHFDAVKEAAYEKSQNDKFNHVTPHTLRHTWATLAAQAGVPLFEIAGVLGDTLATVVRVYAHHCPDHLRGAVNWRDRSGRKNDQQQPTSPTRERQVIDFAAGQVGPKANSALSRR